MISIRIQVYGAVSRSLLLLVRSCGPKLASTAAKYSNNAVGSAPFSAASPRSTSVNQVTHEWRATAGRVPEDGMPWSCVGWTVPAWDCDLGELKALRQRTDGFIWLDIPV